MLVRRLVLVMSLLFGFVGTAHAEQEPTFVMMVKKPVGGWATQHEMVEDLVRAREPVLKTTLLAKTKQHPASRLTIVAKLHVQPSGNLKPEISEGIDH